MAVALTLPLVACGGKQTPASIFEQRGSVSFADVRRAIDDLYRSSPGIRHFVVRDVEYNTTTLNKVLDVCRRGGAERTPGTRETSQVFACAPLIFFFYEYGRRRSEPAATDVAAKLYRYAVTHVRGPYDAGAELTRILRRWGVR